MVKKATSTGQSFFSKHGDLFRKAHEVAKNQETSYSQFGELPSGIENGVAELVECKIDTYKSGDNEGEYYFLAAGIIKSPESHDGVKILGKRTQIMEPLCETPKAGGRKTIADHLEWVYNELRKLGLDTSELDGEEELLAGMEALVESGVNFNFRTWKGKPTEEYPDPRTRQDWLGSCESEDDEEDDGGKDTKDNSGKSSKTPIKKKESEVKSAKSGKTKESKVTIPPEKELKVLAKKADKGDVDSCDKLTAFAVSLGYEEEKIEDTDKWSEVVAMILSGPPKDDDEEEDEEEEIDEEEVDEDEESEEEEEESEEEEEDEEDEEKEEEPEKAAVPKVSEIWEYAPFKAGSKTKRDKSQQVSIVKVDLKKKTVTCKNPTTKTVFKDVPFSDLSSDE